MKLIEARLIDINSIAKLHWLAYHEKFTNCSDDFNEYLEFTCDDIFKRIVVVDSQLTCLIVLEKVYDILIPNADYFLVKRIYVVPSERHKGKAKELLHYCRNNYGPLMGWKGKFYKLEETL